MARKIFILHFCKGFKKLDLNCVFLSQLMELHRKILKKILESFGERILNLCYIRLCILLVTITKDSEVN